jgi:hypothetical protein
MKKRLSILFAVLAALAIFTSTAFAAPAGKSVKFLSVAYQKGGIVLLFETSGLTKADLKDNSFYADSNDQKMSCNFVDDTTTARCTVSKALAGKGGFFVTLAGFGFWGELPQEKVLACEEGTIPWYTVDIYQDGELLGSDEIPVWFWNELVANGLLDQAAEFGVTFDITGTFCAPDFEFGPEV